MIEISRHAPEDVLAQLTSNNTLIHLISQGYEEGGAWARTPLERAQGEYDHLEHGVVFLAQEGGETVGSLGLRCLAPKQENDAGKKLWRLLLETDPVLARRMIQFNPLVCEVDSIVVDPRIRREGIGRSLLFAAAEQLRPAAMIGRTRRPAAIATRLHLGEKRYRTFCGTTEVTPHHPQEYTEDHFAFLAAYHNMRQFMHNIEGMIYVMDTGIVYPLPSAQGYPKIVQRAFKNIEDAHAQYNGQMMVMAPLLSLPEEVLSESE